MSSKFFDVFVKSNGAVPVDKPLDEKVLKVVERRCPQNHPCPSVSVCPVGALSQKGYDAPIVDMDKCIRCGKCTRSCPMRALVLE